MRKLIFIMILTIFAYSVSAHTNNTKTGSLLWKVSGNGLKQPSYIFGTYHLFSFNFLDSVAGAKEAFAKSKQMVGELMMNDMNTLVKEIQAAGIMPQDTTWQMLLSEEDYKFVDKTLVETFGAGFQSFGIFKPSMISVLYDGNINQKNLPAVKQEETLDIWLQQEAIKRGLTVVGLETVQDQIAALFASASLKQQAAYLVCLFKNADYSVNQTKTIIDLYRKADLNEMLKMLEDDTTCPMSAEQQTILIDKRNKRWLEQLPAIMAKHPSFIAVGCLHLPGEIGLLQGLEKLGYKIEAVKK